jgi:hypothetical protein
MPPFCARKLSTGYTLVLNIFSVHTLFSPQRREDAKRNLKKIGVSLRLCAFAVKKR